MSKNTKTVLIVVAIALAAIVIVPSVLGIGSGDQDGGWGMMGSGMWGGSIWMFLMPVFFIAFWGLVIWGIVALVRGSTGSRGSHSGSGRPDSAREILDKRYARGEIDKAEYEERKKDLL